MTPPAVWDWIRKRRASWRHDLIRFSGDYELWARALSASGGYDEPAIVERVSVAARKVRDGEAAFERDGVAFPEMEYNFPLAFALLRAGVRVGQVNVIDFGGSLGSSFFQSWALLDGLLPIRWAVVEQANFVEVGSLEFGDAQLSFLETIEEACTLVGSGVLLLSSVLQYLPDPADFLERVLQHQFQSIIIDRAPFMRDDRIRLTVQHVPPQVYPASYPAWFFDQFVIAEAETRVQIGC